MRSRLLVWAQHLLPQRLLGRCVYHLARCTWPAVRTPLIRWFVRHYAVKLDDAQRPRCEDYASFNDFFTRALRPGARPIAAGDTTLVAAADGRVTEFGTAVDGRALQAKGMPYALEELLGSLPGAGVQVAQGDFATIYLAPYDYHRVHLPLAGTLTFARYIPGKRFSVNAATSHAIPRLFCRNERLILWFDTHAGPMAVVLVGALNVASLATPWLGEVASGQPLTWDHSALAAGSLERGAEIGRFNLGSTVITVMPPGSTRWDRDLAPGTSVRMGQALGSIARYASPD